MPKQFTTRVSRRDVLKKGIVTSGGLGIGSAAIVDSTAAKKRSVAYLNLFLFRGDISEGDVLVLGLDEGEEAPEVEEGLCHSCHQRIQGEEFEADLKDRRGSVNFLSPNRSFSVGDEVEIISKKPCVGDSKCDPDENEGVTILDLQVKVEKIS